MPSKVQSSSPVPAEPVRPLKPSNINEPAACFHAVLPEAQALPTHQLAVFNLDADAAVQVVLGNHPEIKAFVADMATHCPTFDTTHIDRLPVLARALAHIDNVCTLARQPSDELPKLGEEAETLRNRLRHDATALAARGFIDPKLLDKVTGLRGYSNVVADLRVLVIVLRDAWPAIQGKCAIEPGELDQVSELASKIEQLYAVRQESPAVVAQSSDLRARIFTLLNRSYDETRRVITYLRWREGDFDEIAPSIYSARTSASKRKDKQPTPEPLAAQSGPVDPACANPAQPAAASASASTGFQRGGPDGTPGADPFMD